MGNMKTIVLLFLPSLLTIGCGAQIPEVLDCGGFAGTQCPDQQVCYQGLCDENESDCIGFCQVEADCDTRRSLACPSLVGTAMTCGDNPDDSCFPQDGDQDCDETCLFEQPCDPRRACQENYAPVCGTDGVTYDNECFLGLNRCVNPNILMEYSGACLVVEPTMPMETNAPDDHIAHMPEIIECGGVDNIECMPRTDGLQYACYEALCADGDDDCMGYCQVQAECDTAQAVECPAEMYTEMMCGDNPFDDCDPEEHSPGDCDESCAFEQPCNPYNACMEEYDPVCGNDGLTYTNRCWLGLHRCINPTIVIANEGACGDTDTVNPSQMCIEIYQPVCGSNGETYENECMLMNAHAVDDSLTKVADTTCEAFLESQESSATVGVVASENTKIAITVGVIGGVVLLFSLAFLISRYLANKRGNSNAQQNNTPYAEVTEEEA